MTDKQAAQKIYHLTLSLRVYIREQYVPCEDETILSAIQAIQANAIQLGAKPMTRATTPPAPASAESGELR